VEEALDVVASGLVVAAVGGDAEETAAVEETEETVEGRSTNLV
jgi:hypothetical protein